MYFDNNNMYVRIQYLDINSMYVNNVITKIYTHIHTTHKLQQTKGM